MNNNLIDFAELVFIASDKPIYKPEEFKFSISNENYCYTKFLDAFAQYSKGSKSLAVSAAMLSSYITHEHTSNIITSEMLNNLVSKGIINKFVSNYNNKIDLKSFPQNKKNNN